jgi:hypothetical protein
MMEEKLEGKRGTKRKEREEKEDHLRRFSGGE